MDDALYRLHAEREETYWWWVAKNRIILSLVERYWRGAATGRALDIGCGAGGVLAKLGAMGFDAVGVDMSPIAREYCAKRGLRAVDGSLPVGLPFTEAESFDVIVMSEVVEHVKEDRAAVGAAARLLRPGGVMVCTVPAHMWLWSRHDEFNRHERRYTRRGFGALFEGLGLEELVLSEYQCVLLPLVVAARWVQRVRVPTGPEVRALPGVVNWALTRVFEAEKLWLPHGRLPWGSSIISVHRRA